jgi:CRP/FNR family transcriptional regulator
MYPSIQLVTSTTQQAAAGQGKCSSCALNAMCLPAGLTDEQVQRIEQLFSRRRRVARDAYLFRMGDRFTNLYIVCKGHFKTDRINEGGMQHITGFHMNGEWLGFDAIGPDRHNSNAVALENSEVCEVPFVQLEKLFAEIPGLMRAFHRLMSREIERDGGNTLLLSNLSAEQRVSAFLVNIASRYEDRGHSTDTLQLPMLREDIGNYLGLTIESISRALSKLKKKGWITVHNRELEILDFGNLEAMASGLEPNERVSKPAAAYRPMSGMKSYARMPGGMMATA